MPDFFWSTKNQNSQDVRCEGGEIVQVFPKNIGTIAADAGNFVFRPGGVAGGAVFTDWPSLAAAVATLDPALEKTISVDDSLAAAHATTGNWPGFENVQFQSGGPDGSNSAQATLIFDTGCRLTGGVEHLDFVQITCQFADAAGTVIPATTANLAIYCNGGNLQNTGGAAGGLATMGAGFTLSYRSFASALGANIFKGSATSTYALLLFSGSSLQTNTVNGTAGGTVLIVADGSSQSGVSGTTQTPAATVEILDPVSTFVFRPGGTGTVDGNVFTTWAALASAIALTAGPRFVLIDGSLAVPHMTAGGPYDLDNTHIFFEQSAANFTLIIDQGASFTSSNLTIEGGGVQNQSTVSPWIPTSFVELFLLNEGEVFSQAGKANFLTINAAATGSIIVMYSATALGDGTHNTVTVAAGQTLTTYVSTPQNATGGGILAHAFAGAGTVAVIASDGAPVSTTQDVTTFTTSFPTTTNTTQASGNTGTGTGTLSVVTGNIKQQKSGKVLVTANVAGTSAAATTITLQLVRDAATNIGNTIVETTLSAGDGFHGSITFVDTLPDLNNHTYKLTATAGAGNLTAGGANSVQITAVEL